MAVTGALHAEAGWVTRRPQQLTKSPRAAGRLLVRQVLMPMAMPTRLYAGRVAVVDYKTDAVSGAGMDARMRQYAPQGGVYALLVAETTGREVAWIGVVFAASRVTGRVREVAGVIDEALTVLRGAAGVLVG